LPTTYTNRLKTATKRRSACDWVSMTSRSKSSADSLWSLGQRLLGPESNEGEQPTRWHAHGYDGWRIRGLALGCRADGVHLVLSSSKAAEHWKHAVVAGENCTRIDVALDLYFDTPMSHVARDSYLKSAGHRPITGRPPARRLIISGDGGSTFYTGSRSSERMGRLYDKGVETKTLAAGKWWRWEVEFKGDAANAASAAALSAPNPERWFHSTAARFFLARGAIAPAGEPVSEIYNLCPEPTSDERLLSWLAVGVRPTVARLIERLGPERVRFSLGLPLTSAVHPAAPDTTLN